MMQAPPNKPMVPTAPHAPAANTSRPLRRHIGQPLDSAQGGGWRAAGGGRRPTKERVAVHGQWTTRTVG